MKKEDYNKSARGDFIGGSASSEAGSWEEEHKHLGTMVRYADDFVIIVRVPYNLSRK